MDEAATLTRVPRAARAQDTAPLFQPYRLGPFNLRHRVVMAPLTRSRARQPGNVPSSLAACYYAQRASAALIVSEATQVSMRRSPDDIPPFNRETIKLFSDARGQRHAA